MLIVGIMLLSSSLAVLSGQTASPQKITCLYNSLDPLSVAQHLALYQLYPDTPEGQRALADSWQLLSGSKGQGKPLQLIEGNSLIESLVALINKKPNDSAPQISEEALTAIESMAESLGNRRLKGHFANSEAEILALPTDQIDLARGLFLSQFGDTPTAKQQLRCYEAQIDLMALQIRARLSPKAKATDKINLINRLIFYELNFRFPPHSKYAKEIDLYTFLPSVIDSRRGVCLGVSILYLALAQRLELDLEIVTPPGHIYVRHRNGNHIINIETTARGVHVDCDEYLSVDTHKLQQRNLKEVIGMAYFNQAAALLTNDQYEAALACYETAARYQPDDLLVKEFMGYCYILAGNEERGCELLKQTAAYIPEYAVTGSSIASDYLNGLASKEALAAILMHVDESRASILSKQKLLQAAVADHPNFRAAIFALAATWLQLHRHGEALEVLEQFHALDSNDPTAEYYLAALYAERYHYPKAWHHLHQAEKLTAQCNYTPEALRNLRQELNRYSPECVDNR